MRRTVADRAQLRGPRGRGQHGECGRGDKQPSSRASARAGRNRSCDQASLPITGPRSRFVSARLPRTGGWAYAHALPSDYARVKIDCYLVAR